ncbi:MAG: error-prone DNA polymerase, partial [Gammaproteobacteria bacterium]|nr:error-prone DNA polymerase [Gammaproteobacteria bacterium]
DLINGWRGAEPPLGMQQVPAGDAAVYAMIQRAETTGVFQIESRAQMAMLPRLKPACFYDLVIEVAIVRPGPIQGDMVHPYLRRRQGLEPVVYPSPEVEEVLGRTLGVPIFQEQVIKVAMVAAGFSPGEADRLRRSIAAWRRRGTLQQFESRLVEGMVARGYEESFARRIYQQILGFGEYGFPESHAASFALLVYVSAWLKWHHPAAFFAALLNSQPMGFYAPAQLIQEARRQGVTVAPVDVRRSEWECTLEAAAGSPGPQLRLGLRMIKGLPRAGVERLMKARAEADFLTVQDLARRASLSKGDLQRLAAAGALAGLAGNRHQAAWLVMGMEPALPLIGTVVEEAIPALPLPTEGENIRADYANLGLTLERHPLALLRFQLGRRRVVTAAEVRARRHGQLIRTAGIVIGRQRPASANSVTFVTLEDETGQVNLVVWRQLAERQRSVLLKAQLLGVSGEVQREGEVLHVIARRLWDYSFLLGRLLTRSRDFH